MSLSNSTFGIKLLVSLLLCCEINNVYGTKVYNKDWSVASIIAPISDHSSFKYFVEEQVRLIDNRSVFNQYFVLGGLGYQFHPDFLLISGGTWILSKSPEGNTHTEKRVWEQLNWQILNNIKLNLNSRTRFEVRDRTGQTRVAYRFRERLWLRVALKKWESYSFSCFNEILLDLNHPGWTSPYFFEQNRAFVGIAKRLTKSAILDFGYMNQHIRSFNNQSNNVLLLNFSMYR